MAPPLNRACLTVLLLAGSLLVTQAVAATPSSSGATESAPPIVAYCNSTCPDGVYSTLSEGFNIVQLWSCTCNTISPDQPAERQHYVEKSDGGFRRLTNSQYELLRSTSNEIMFTTATAACKKIDVDAYVDLLLGNPTTAPFPCSQQNLGANCSTVCQDFTRVLGVECLESNPGVLNNPGVQDAFAAQGYTEAEAVAIVYDQCQLGAEVKVPNSSWALGPGMGAVLAILFAVAVAWGA